MRQQFRTMFAGLCAAALLGTWTTAGAQSAEAKEKPPMYTYVASWAFPRARWAEVDKAGAANLKIFDKAVATGTLVGYGDDTNLVHQAEGSTHDTWWSSMSMAGLLNVLEDLSKNGSATSSVLATATKHEDNLYVSRFYNWHPGSWKGAYTHTAAYRLKPSAPDDAIEMLAKHHIVPIMEKLLAAGTVVEYEVDEEAIHTQSPDMFWVTYITPSAEDQDKVRAAVREAFKANPFAGPAADSMVDSAAHRDYLSQTNGVYK